ncbi:Required for respiratory growth protein 9 mitochondrial [Paramarasmius palmivorus]|uniref:Required for respiratory growth protein 9, mitochondrial n=1 Tax=Paramarasmius palmivorus TaxID=297713 RepID=A0AAW0D7X1_9AGAR
MPSIERDPTPFLCIAENPRNHPRPRNSKLHRDAMQKNFPDGWNPPKKLSREAMEGLRELHHLDKEKFSTPVLAEKFRISPEAVRRILKSKWEQPKEKREKLAERDRQHASLTRLKERLKERMEADRLTAERTGQAIGVSSKDRFTFQ